MLLNRFQSCHRCWIVRTRLTTDDTFSGFKRHHLLNLIQFDRALLLITTGLIIKLAGNTAFQQIQRGFTYLCCGHYRINRAIFKRCIGTFFDTCADPLIRVINTDQTRQTNGAAPTGEDTQFYFRQAHFGLITQYSVICRQGDLKPTTEAKSVNCCNGGGF